MGLYSFAAADESITISIFAKRSLLIGLCALTARCCFVARLWYLRCHMRLCTIIAMNETTITCRPCQQYLAGHPDPRVTHLDSEGAPCCAAGVLATVHRNSFVTCHPPFLIGRSELLTIPVTEDDHDATAKATFALLWFFLRFLASCRHIAGHCRFLAIQSVPNVDSCFIPVSPSQPSTHWVCVGLLALVQAGHRWQASEVARNFRGLMDKVLESGNWRDHLAADQEQSGIMMNAL